MMERFTMYPMAFITTVQPYLLAWVLTIAGFLTLAIVALLSREKTWKQIAALSAGTYLIVMIITMLCTSAFLDIHVMEVEMVWVQPRSSGE